MTLLDTGYGCTTQTVSVEQMITIRAFELQDLQAVAALEVAVFGRQAAYPLFFFRQAFELFGELFYVAEDRLGDIVGYTLGAVQPAAAAGWVMHLGVQPVQRRRGVAVGLLQALLAAFADKGTARVLLTVAPDNHAALGLYRKLGFCEIRREAAYFGAGESRIVMQYCNYADFL